MMISWNVVPEHDPNQLLKADAKGTRIHPSAIIAPGAQLGSEVQIGPNAIIGANVRLGDRVCVGAGAIIDGDVSIDEETHVFPYATIGSMPQDLKFEGEPSKIVIGKRNKIREYVNISSGTKGGGAETRIGSDNLLMVYTHIAHDAVVGDHCVFANGVQIAGHVVIGNKVVFGGLSAAHQFCLIGDMSMIAAGSMVVQDVAPFCMVQGDRAALSGLNVVGLRRSGLSPDIQSDIKQIYRLVFQEKITVSEAIEKIETEIKASPAKDLLVNFLKKSERGLCR